VQRGTLRRGDVLVCEKTWARVRTLYDEHGKVVQSATLSVPVEVAGWKEGLPGAGDDVLQVATEVCTRALQMHHHRA
jgi:translation initiation factor IF-2